MLPQNRLPQDLEHQVLVVELTSIHQGLRLDRVLAQSFPMHSRVRLANWIKEAKVWVDSVLITQPKYKVQGRERIVVHAMSSAEAQPHAIAEPIPLDIVYEDETLLVINKPDNFVVHPGAGNRQGTLFNALLHYAPSLRLLPRAGIVHRLDKDTTGLMVVAKTLTAHTMLVRELACRKIEREYLALVGKELISGQTIEAPIARHPLQRLKMAVQEKGKPALTHYRCYKRYKGFTLLHVKLETGRTHQIRVHLAYTGTPIVGDALYGWRYATPPKPSLNLQNVLRALQRQALHAWRLRFIHPITGASMAWEAPLPADFAALLSVLEEKS